MSKKKLALFAMVGMLALAVLVGGATLALFTDSTDNGLNTFASGTLEFSGHRHDVPISGPMFYTNAGDAEGWMETGIWVPRDTHTRAMFIKNTGSLKGELTNLVAKSTSPGAEAFAEQAHVNVAVFKAPAGSDLAASVMDALNHFNDDLYRLGMNYWLSRPGTRTLAQLNADIREQFLMDNLFDRLGGPWVSVDVVYQGTLKDLMDGTASMDEVVVAPGETIYMGYNVTLLSSFDVAGFKSNDIQGADVEFEFEATFTQLQ